MLYWNSSSFHPDGEDHDTVGAVAIDANGNVAYATSTGGISAKLNGRVGDSPLIGMHNQLHTHMHHFMAC